jgi:hypothetical protein
MVPMIDVRVLVLVDGDGEWVVGKTLGDLDGRYTEDVGSDTGCPRRVIEIILKVPLPAAVKMTGEVPAEIQPSGLTVK